MFAKDAEPGANFRFGFITLGYACLVGEFHDGDRRSYTFGPSTRFLVHDERRDDRTGNVVDRALVAKMTYLMAFLRQRQV